MPAGLHLFFLLFVSWVHLASAGCSASGVSGNDNAGDCAALVAIYNHWGTARTDSSAIGLTNNGVGQNSNRELYDTWGQGIKNGISYCSWLNPWRQTLVGCDANGRVSWMCVPTLCLAYRLGHE